MATTDTLITLTSALIESFEVNYAVASLLLYDYIICFGEEVRLSEIKRYPAHSSFVSQGRIFLGWSMVALQVSLPRCKGSLCSLSISFASTEPRIRSDI